VHSLRPAAVAARTVFDHLSETRLFGIAAEMAFWLFTALLPLAVVAGYLAARLATTHSVALGAIIATFPPATRELFASELGKVAAWRGEGLGLPVGLTFVWLASSGVHAIFDGFESQLGVSRPWWRKRVIAIATCFALSLGVAVIALLGPGLSAIARLAAYGLASMPSFAGDGLGSVTRVVLSLALGTGLVALLYAVGVPRRRRDGLPLWPGALTATLLQGLLGYLYALYVSSGGGGSAYQAGLAVIAATMTALYLLAIALLLGVEVNRYVARRRQVPKVNKPDLPRA